jgi:hypothetical protein
MDIRTGDLIMRLSDKHHGIVVSREAPIFNETGYSPSIPMRVLWNGTSSPSLCMVDKMTYKRVNPRC